MKGYVAKKRNRYYAVIYEGLDPITGKELRTWHRAGTNKADAEKLARRLASEVEGRNDDTRSLTLGAYLTTQWLPGKKITLAESTWHGYRRKIERHILPVLGPVPIRRLKVTQTRSAVRVEAPPDRPQRQGAGTKDRAGDSSHHSRFARRRRATRDVEAKRRHRRSRPEAAVDPQTRSPSVDSRTIAGVSSCRGRAPVLCRLVSCGVHRGAP